MPRLCLPSAIALALAFIASACTPVVTTSTFSLHQPQSTKHCRNAIATYALPRRVLRFKVQQMQLDATKGTYYYNLAEGNGADTDTRLLDTIADGDGRNYCIERRNSVFHADHVGAEVDQHGLLKAVHSKVIDKSVDVAKTAIEGAGLLSAARRARKTSIENSLRLGFGEAEEGDDQPKAIAQPMEFEIDPFDREDLTAINTSLKKYGYCLYISSERDRYVPEWMERQCHRHRAHSAYRQDRRTGGTARPRNRKGPLAGIFYRPLLTHKLVIMRKADPTSSAPWQVWKTKRIKMPNVAPTFELQVSRGLFADRKTDIVFKDGLLVDVTVDKKSELNGFIDIPIRAVEVVIQIPVKALVIGISDADNQARIIQANRQLLDTIYTYEKALEEQQLKIDGLTPEEVALIAAQGGIPGINRNGNRVNRELSYEACLRNAVLEDGTDPELKCAEIVGGN